MLFDSFQTAQDEAMKQKAAKDAAYKPTQDRLNSMHGAANAKDAVQMRSLLAEAKQYGDYGGIEDIYNQHYKDAEAQEQARAAAVQRKVDVGNQKNTLINSYGDEARRGLANNIAQSKRGASSRGLLYSNQLQGNIQAQRSQAAGAMAGYQSTVNKASDDQTGQLAAQSAQRGMQNYSADMSRNQNDQKDALARYKQKQGVLGGIGSGLGAAAGAFLPF